MSKLVSTYMKTHTHTRTGGNLPIPANKTLTDDSFFATAPRNICNLEYLQSLSPSSFEEDTLMVDNGLAGNVDKRGE